VVFAFVKKYSDTQLIACMLGFLNSFRMVRMPDHEPSGAAEGVLIG